MSNDAYATVARCPSVEEYSRLRDAAGLSPFTSEAVRIALPRSIHAVVIELEGHAIGMGRIIVDGGCFFQITDITVDPAHQGKGLGKRIMAALMEHVATLPASAYVSLIADKPADRLYAHYGFRDVGPRSIGMSWQP